MDNQKLNLYQRISAVMNDVQYLQKDDTVGTGNYGYKAISIEKVTEAVRQAMVRHGLVILPIEQVHVMEDKQRVNNKGEAVLVPITTVDVRYKLVNIDNPTEFEIIVSAGTGVDPQDKGVGKAMTYAYKNLLLRTFAIPTGDDTDKTHNKDLEEQQNKAAAKAAEEAKKPITAAQQEKMLKLIQDPVFTQKEKDDLVANISRYTKEKAEVGIDKMKAKIEASKQPANAA